MFAGYESFLVCRRIVGLSTEVAARWVKGRGFTFLNLSHDPMPRLKRKGLTQRSNTKLIVMFYFLSHNQFIKFIIILLQFQETCR